MLQLLNRALAGALSVPGNFERTKCLFCHFLSSHIMEVWVTVLVQKQSHVMKGEARVQMTNKNQTLEKKSRIHAQKPISCNQTCTNTVTHSVRHTTVLQDSMTPLVQGLTSFGSSPADLGFTLCIITQSLLLQQNNEANRNTVKTGPGPLPVRITIVPGQVLSWPNVENIQFQGLVSFTTVSEASKEEPFPVRLRFFLLHPPQNPWT